MSENLRRLAPIAATLSVILFLMLALPTALHSRRIYPLASPHRKLLVHSEASATLEEPNRVWGDKCSRADILINQGPAAPLPTGIPTYTVEIINVCVTGCDIAGIHLTCGWFSSIRLVNPRIFKRLRYNDCIVNDGKPLANGRTLSFQYANSFRYPLSVQRVRC
ncbi:Tapetum determinant 1 [Heracleum sosnowskyi]|uniref:Tapetum determinant 1 n=1 Tax=Heracleum sosnowskyi TaxID=360622 RepID=A0AAD8H1J0_9APIA|nr:Tapetum determinant 1 [Heracleum sosnowskyi]